MSATVLVGDPAPGVRRLTLNRPERLNAINLALMTDLNDALAAALGDDAVGAIILDGAGRAFCAGDDLIDQRDMMGWGAERIRPFVEAIQDVTRHIVLGDKPVVCAVHGWAVGGAFSWPINADFSIWAEDARAFFPEVSYGLFVSGGVTRLLAGFVGRARAHEMLYLGRKYDAAVLHEYGLAWRVVPGDVLEAEALALATELAALPAAARRAMKRCTTQVDRAALEDALARETDAVVDSIADPETYRRIEALSQRGRKK